MTTFWLLEQHLPTQFNSLHIDSALQSEASDDGLFQYSQYNAPSRYPRYTRYNQPAPPSSHAMSTRRSTRGASRQASSRGASPAISTSDIPATPRRTSNRRQSNALPAVGARQSTAYGSNTIPPPAADAPPVARGFSEVLEAELNPISIPRPKAPSNVSRTKNAGPSSTPAVSEKSYIDESAIFQRAGIESSPISEGEELENIPEVPEPSSDNDSDDPPDHMNDFNGRAERQKMEEMAANHRSVAPARTKNSFATTFDKIKNNIWYPFLEQYIKKWIIRGLLPYLLAIALGLYCLWRLYSGVLSGDLQNSLPNIISNPSDVFHSSDVHSITRRLTDLEHKVARLLSDNSALDPNALETIRDMLPDFLVVKEDKYGNIVIPDNFWHALRDKIREDDTLSHGHIDSGKASSGGHGVKDLEKETRFLWDKYVKSNKAQMEELSNHDITQKFPGLLKQNHIIPKTEVLRLIQDSWEDNQQLVKSEMSVLTKKLNTATKEISLLRHDFQYQSDAIANDVLKKFIPNGQLDALAAANLKSNLNHGLKRVNFLSKGTGAAIDKTNMSPNYVVPDNDFWFPNRIMHSLTGNPIPPPNPPIVALLKWEEHGDCWCSPSADADGFGPSLAVLLGSSIYPEQVVVEHILPTASLEPGAAPREMELLAYFPDPEVLRKVSEFSDSVFQSDADDESLPVDPLRTRNFVRIATWTYQRDTTDNIQSFDVQLDLKSLGAHTSKVIIRSKNNWGGGKVDHTCLYRVRLHGEIATRPGLF
ncbi:uncharacterized protein RAG0_00688 [Rhynchosporium agropyri]|uniref:SUN domain-containing protein n=1 Tax=Rhynchosporium agropyri TaxID=914238 RepID=A0A1E1JUD7_9HELO|nr:uncharacterized protein RAG0_00688 [Rhynchosporium agropyri]